MFIFLFIIQSNIRAYKISEISNRFTLGYSNADIWFKITIENKSDLTNFVLNFNEAIWSKFDFYHQTSQGWQVKKAGLLVPLTQREIQNVLGPELEWI